MHKALVFALAGLAAFANASTDVPKNFSLIATKTSDKKVSLSEPLYATLNGTEYVFSFGSPDDKGSPTLFSFAGTGTYKILSFLVADEDAEYGLAVPEVGDAYGTADSVFADIEDFQAQWTYDPKSKAIGHKLQAALNEFYICKDSTSDGEGKYLKWGTPQEKPKSLPPPVGCEVAELTQA